MAVGGKISQTCASNMYLTRSFFAVMVLAAGAVVFPARAEELAPVALRCEYRVNPLGLDEAQPRLTWRVESSVRGAKQTAYQILVA